MKKKKVLSVVLVSVLLVGILAACQPPAPVNVPTETPAPTTTTTPATLTTPADTIPEQGLGRGVTLAIMAETPSITPARHATLVGLFKNELTHSGLFRPRYEDLAPIPNVVREWRAISDTLFEFTIYEGIRFHNGDVMTAYDVAASLEYVRRYPEQAIFHGSAVSWEVVDRYTIQIDTSVPNALLLNDLSHQANFIFPMSLIEAGHDFTLDPVGSGPFVFEEWQRGDFLHFTAFEDYFDAPRAAKVEYIHWRIIPEGASRTIALEAGEVDYIVDVAFPDITRMEADPNITVKQRPGAMFQYFVMNNSRAPFDNVYVRRAIDMALDREAMVLASLEGFGIPIYSTMPPIFPGSSNEGTRSFDPEGAIALLAEQGISQGELEFEILVFDEQQRRRAEVAQSNLADIGITATINMMDFATWTVHTQDDTYDTSFANFTQTSLLAFMRATMSIGTINAQNRSRIYNPELDAMIFEALGTVDESARIALLEEASRMANEYVGHIGTNMNLLIRAFNSNLIVPELAANGSMHLNMIHWAE